MWPASAEPAGGHRAMGTPLVRVSMGLVAQCARVDSSRWFSELSSEACRSLLPHATARRTGPVAMPHCNGEARRPSGQPPILTGRFQNRQAWSSGDVFGSGQPGLPDFESSVRVTAAPDRAMGMPSVRVTMAKGIRFRRVRRNRGCSAAAQVRRKERLARKHGATPRRARHGPRTDGDLGSRRENNRRKNPSQGI